MYVISRLGGKMGYLLILIGVGGLVCMAVPPIKNTVQALKQKEKEKAENNSIVKIILTK